MKLKSALKSLEIPALRAIQQFWQLADPADEASPLDAEQWVEYLYGRLQNPAAFRKVYDQLLDEGQRNLLCFLTIHGGFMEEKELRKRFFDAENRDQMKGMLDTLIGQGLLAVERWTELEDKPRVYGIPEPYQRFIELPHFWKGYLGGLLRDLPTEQLQKIATNGLALKIQSVKRDHLIYHLRKALTDPAILRGYIDSLPNPDREALLLLLQRRGVCVYRDLLDGAQSRPADFAKGDAIEHLIASTGLLFLTSDNVVRHQNLLRVPRDVYYIITHHFIRDQRGLKELDAMNQVDPKVQPKVVLDNGVSILRDVAIFANHVAGHSARRLTSGGIGKKDLKKVLPFLSANKTVKYAQFLAFYCIRKKYLAPTGEHWRVTASFREQLKDSRLFYIDLYASWFETNEWNEEYVEGDCVHSETYPSNLIDIVELRKVALDNLARIPFDTWIDGPRFIESLLAQIELRMPKRGSKGRLDKLNRINYMVIESILCESLYWLGLISLGLHERTSFAELGNRTSGETECGSGHGRPSEANDRIDHHFNFNPRSLQSEIYHFHFKINGLGRSILRAAADNPTKLLNPKTPIALPFRDDLVHFTILPNLDVIAPPDLNLQHFLQLISFAEIRHIDVMSTLAITHDSLRAAMDQGMKDQAIIEFLEAGCPSGLPETVYHLISECGHRYGEILIGSAGGFINVEDPVLIEDIKANKALTPYIKDIVGGRIVILGQGVDVTQVARELQRMGFMPSVENEHIHPTSEGRLHFTITPEDLSSLMAVLRFVRQIEDDLDSQLTEGKARQLVDNLRPVNLAQFNLSHYSETLCKRFSKIFEGAVKKKIDSVSSKYRKQIRDFLAQRMSSKERASYQGANPATETEDIARLVRFAIENESSVEMQYVRSTQEEIVERARPESLNGDKLFAFSERTQSYCAYRLARVRSAKLV